MEICLLLISDVVVTLVYLCMHYMYKTATTEPLYCITSRDKHSMANCVESNSATGDYCTTPVVLLTQLRFI